MTMLSSVAERLYWTARYFERAESTARLVNAYSQFILDIPMGFEPGWQSLIRIIDGNAAFDERYQNYTERNVIKFLLADLDNPGSVRYSIKKARENVRTTRDALPEDYWELVNELNLYVSDFAVKSIARRNRFEFIDATTAKMLQITGLVHSSMTRDEAWQFLKLGSLVECADMTSRVVDVAATTTLELDEENAWATSWLWINLLRSITALSAYRREAGPVTETSDIIDFIFKSETFARSLHFCLNNIEERIESLSNPENVRRIVRKTRAPVLAFDTEKFSLKELHNCIDGFQRHLIELNDEIHRSWFHR